MNDAAPDSDAPTPLASNVVGMEPPPGFKPPPGFVLAPDFEQKTIDNHLPVVQEDDGGITVRVGKELHMMAPEHHIEWILIVHDKGALLRSLAQDEPPEIYVSIDASMVHEVYAYCNLHGLWKMDMNGAQHG